MPPTDASQLVADPGPQAYPSTLTDDQIDHLAEMVADDRCAFPDDLTPPDQARLLYILRGLLRKRLVQHIAHAIAHHLHNNADPPAEVPDHA